MGEVIRLSITPTQLSFSPASTRTPQVTGSGVADFSLKKTSYPDKGVFPEGRVWRLEKEEDTWLVQDGYYAFIGGRAPFRLNLRFGITRSPEEVTFHEFHLDSDAILSLVFEKVVPVIALPKSGRLTFKFHFEKPKTEPKTTRLSRLNTFKFR